MSDHLPLFVFVGAVVNYVAFATMPAAIFCFVYARIFRGIFMPSRAMSFRFLFCTSRKSSAASRVINLGGDNFQVLWVAAQWHLAQMIDVHPAFNLSPRENDCNSMGKFEPPQIPNATIPLVIDLGPYPACRTGLPDTIISEDAEIGDVQGECSQDENEDTIVDEWEDVDEVFDDNADDPRDPPP